MHNDYLILGGAGLVGLQVCRRIARELNPNRVVVASLLRHEAEHAVSLLKREFGEEIVDMPVEKLMSKGVVSCDPDCSVEDALTMMRDNQIRHLPVIENGTDLVAMVSIRDLTDAQSDMLRKAS